MYVPPTGGGDAYSSDGGAHLGPYLSYPSLSSSLERLNRQKFSSDPYQREQQRVPTKFDDIRDEYDLEENDFSRYTRPKSRSQSSKKNHSKKTSRKKKNSEKELVPLDTIEESPAASMIARNFAASKDTATAVLAGTAAAGGAAVATTTAVATNAAGVGGCCCANAAIVKALSVVMLVGVVAGVGYATYNGVNTALGDPTPGTTAEFTATYDITTSPSVWLEQTSSTLKTATIRTNPVTSVIPTTSTTTTTTTTRTTTTTTTPTPISSQKTSSSVAMPSTTISYLASSTISYTSPSAATTQKQEEICGGSFRNNILSTYVHNAPDDRRCQGISSGFHPSNTSCQGFFLCCHNGRLGGTGSCPNTDIYHDVTKSCEPSDGRYYRDPLDCGTFFQCKDIGGYQRYEPLDCPDGYALSLENAPNCLKKELVPECLSSTTDSRF